MLRQIFLGFLVIGVTACAHHSKPTPRQPPSIDIPQQWQTQVLNTKPSLSRSLLDVFKQPVLENLLEQTLEQNKDLAQTALRLQEQQLLVQQTQVSRLPELSLDFDAQRSKNTNSQYDLGLNLSWELDVWGRLADSQNATEAEAQALQFDYAAARDSLAARVIQHWIDLSIRAQIILTETQWLESLRNTEAIITERYRNGLGNIADLEAARTATAQIRASLLAREQQQRDVYHQLSILQGKVSTQHLPQPSLEPLDIANPPAILPADLLQHRHDLLAAYQRVLAANAQQAASYKQLLPSFSLSSSLSQSRPRLDELLSGSLVWNLLGNLTAPLFNGGRLKAAAEIAELQAERSYLSYQQTLVRALHEVENALEQEASLAQQQHYLAIALKHAQASLQHYQARYQEGLNDILDLLDAQRSAFSAQIELLQTQQARLRNRITLALALGIGV